MMHGSRTVEFQQYMEYNICRMVLIDVTGRACTLDEIREIAYPISGMKECKQTEPYNSELGCESVYWS